ncbi:hypothetical protein [Streptomyces sp. NPDC001970]
MSTSRYEVESLWAALPDEVRERVDELVARRRRLAAVSVIWASGFEPRPDLGMSQILIAARAEALGDRVEPPPPRDVETLAATVAGLPRAPVAFELGRDGDTGGWMQVLMTVVGPTAPDGTPGESVWLAAFREVEAGAEEEAASVASVLAERFRVPLRTLGEKP